MKVSGYYHLLAICLCYIPHGFHQFPFEEASYTNSLMRTTYNIHVCIDYSCIMWISYFILFFNNSSVARGSILYVTSVIYFLKDLLIYLREKESKHGQGEGQTEKKTLQQTLCGVQKLMQGWIS